MKNNAINQHQDIIIQYMYIGLLPFFIGAFGPWIFADYEYILTQILIHYSAIILSFLAGALWAVALFTDGNEHKERHIHAAIAFSLIPLLGHLLGYFLPTAVTLGLSILGFLILLFWEKLFLKELYPSWYQELRRRITFIAVACHMLAIWNVIHTV